MYIGNEETLRKYLQDQGAGHSATDRGVHTQVTCLVGHRNKWGWILRHGGWTGPGVATAVSREQLVEVARAMVAEAPGDYVAFIADVDTVPPLGRVVSG